MKYLETKNTQNTITLTVFLGIDAIDSQLLMTEFRVRVTEVRGTFKKLYNRR